MISGRINDLTGLRFSRLTVIEFAGKDTENKSLWLCKCDCGNEITVRGKSLSNKNTQSCGCLRSDLLRNKYDIFRENMIGKVFGRWTVENVSHIHNNSTYYNCKCECGNFSKVSNRGLVSGTSTSCGCLNREITTIRNTTHGLSHHPLYDTWNNMIQRCYNINAPNYQYYGGRGIQVCDEWRYNPASFYSWAENTGYHPDLTIDRYPNNNGNYEPDNCRWATMREQNRNKTNIKLNIEKAENIRKDDRSINEIAQNYNISTSMVRDIKTERKWKS